MKNKEIFYRYDVVNAGTKKVYYTLKVYQLSSKEFEMIKKFIDENI